MTTARFSIPMVCQKLGGQKTTLRLPTHLHLEIDVDFDIPLRSTHELSQEFLCVLIMVTLYTTLCI